MPAEVRVESEYNQVTNGQCNYEHLKDTCYGPWWCKCSDYDDDDDYYYRTVSL